MIEQLAGKVFATRDTAHKLHWKTDSIAKHEALGDFYPAVIDKLDEIVEAHQGLFGRRVGEIADATRPRTDLLIAHLASEVEWIAANRAKIAQGSAAIENLVDELSVIYMKVLYKLRFLD